MKTRAVKTDTIAMTVVLTIIPDRSFSRKTCRENRFLREVILMGSDRLI